MTPDSKPFYVGYQPRMAAPIASFVRRRVLAIAAIGLVALLACVLAQGAFAPGVFEFGDEREFDGWIETFPVPALVVERPGEKGAADSVSRWLLVDQGKFSALPRVAALAGMHVSVRGTLVFRAGTTMLELASDPRPHASPSAPPAASDVDLGIRTFTGEICDSKCWLGVMKPGEKKIHRACAIRCISGGVPPLLVVDAGGALLQLILVDVDGSAVNDRVLDRVAEPLEITGRVVRRGGLLFLHSDPATYRRLDAR